MDLGTVMSVAQTLFAALQCKELKEVCSFLGYKSQLAELQRTVGVIQAVLRDAETKAKEELSHQAQLWIQELKDAVYDADDLLDKFVSLAKQEQLMEGGKASKKVRLLLSRHNPFGVAYKMSQGVKKIRKNLEAITKNHADFGFKVDSQPMRRRRKETCSYVYENNIIGREDDLQKIIGHMFEDSDVKQDVSVLSIVGIGGLGKTALSQLLYNHTRVSTAFPLKLWTCVSDCDQEDELNVLLILRKILAAATGQNDEGSTKESLQIQLRQRLTGKKYLLVLDDVWTESRIQWLELEDFLMGGQRGSWIVVTTRSHETTRIVGSGLTYTLQGLSEDNSRRLFKSIAFGSEQSNPPDDLVKIGEAIVEGCARVPLAIKVAGSLLYGKEDKIEWLSFKEKGLSKHIERQKNILPILEFSYHQLESPLKSCFTYCALFTKDAVILKDTLISLWMANEFVVPLDDGQKLEDAAEEYFSILLRRCFFQDIEVGSYGEIVSCKIHDLMHDVAQKVAGREMCILNLVNDDVPKESRHLSYVDHCRLSSNLSKIHVRSYIYSELDHTWVLKMEQACLEAILANWMHLRVLDLQAADVVSLPETIGELLQLRYLDLSMNYDLKVLPKSFSKLYNLQNLKLQYCHALKELPKDSNKLVNMRTLDISRCISLSNMPEGISKLSYLQVLTRYVIDGSNLSRKQWCDQLGELRKLDSLKGKLEVIIKVGENSIDVREDGTREGAYLRGKQHLNHLTIEFSTSGYEEGKVRLLEELQPHPNLKSLKLWGYKDPMMRMPGWANNLAISLPNLTSLSFYFCNVEYLSCLGNLLHLKELCLWNMEKLEYIYEDRAVASSNGTTTSMPHGFPSLEKITFWSLPKLKGWGNSKAGKQDTGNTAHLLLPQLNLLNVKECPELICILVCPNLKELHLRNFNRKLQLVTLGNTIDTEKKEASAPSSSSSYGISKLDQIFIDDVSWLNSFRREDLQCLRCIHIEYSEVESLGEAEEGFRGCASSLQTLLIDFCPKLKRVWSGGLEHLVALQYLRFTCCDNVRLLGKEEEREDGISMSRLTPLKSLRTLILPSHQQLADLEKWIPFLVVLEFLSIIDCTKLESVPNWLPKLTSLKELRLLRCSASLKERCKHTTGQDWPYIQHIPTIKFPF